MRDAGDYECVVKSAVNEISSKTSVSIEGAPGAPGGVQVIQISKTKAIIEWVDGANNGRPIRYYNILGRTNWNRTWVNVSMYQCGAQNQLKTSFSSAQLRVLSMKPSFKKHPLESEIYAVYNGNTTIVCNPEAAPRPKFQWKKDGQLLGSGGHRRILPSGTLTIAPTSRDDEGVYTCIASNQAGTDESHARVIVLRKILLI